MKKKGLYITILLGALLILSGCGNKKFQGYWCNYDETATIVVLLNKNNTEQDRKSISEKIESFENVSSSSFYSREDYAAELGEDISNLDIYDTYVIHFDSFDSIGTYVKELGEMNGVKSSEQSNVKSGIALYNIQNKGKYTFTDSDESSSSDLEKGTYKIKKGVIIFTPNNNGASRLLYIKNDTLCADADCNEIFAKSNETCNSRN